MGNKKRGRLTFGKVKKITFYGKKIDKMGNLMIQWNGFNKPAGIAYDSKGNIYVVDKNNQQVKIFGLPK
ncbi:MAG: hypothetical protein AB1567_12255 [bacterium]